mgnify:CR=1 FL=1
MYIVCKFVHSWNFNMIHKFSNSICSKSNKVLSYQLFFKWNYFSVDFTNLLYIQIFSIFHNKDLHKIWIWMLSFCIKVLKHLFKHLFFEPDKIINISHASFENPVRKMLRTEWVYISVEFFTTAINWFEDCHIKILQAKSLAFVALKNADDIIFSRDAYFSCVFGTCALSLIFRLSVWIVKCSPSLQSDPIFIEDRES